MVDDFRDERGRLKPGAPPLYKGKQAQQDEPDTQSDPDALPLLDSTFDDDLIAAADSFGKPRTKTGRRAYCEWLRDNRATEFAPLLSKALARRAEAAQAVATGTSGVKVIQIGMIPSDHYVSGDVMRALVNGDLQIDEPQPPYEPTPPSPPPIKPTLVHPRDKDYTLEEVKRMTKAELAAAIAAGEIVFGEDDD